MCNSILIGLIIALLGGSLFHALVDWESYLFANDCSDDHDSDEDDQDGDDSDKDDQDGDDSDKDDQDGDDSDKDDQDDDDPDEDDIN